MKIFFRRLGIGCLLLAWIGLRDTRAQVCQKPFRIVVLGSSTAAGGGATPRDSGWVFKYTDSMKRINAAYQVFNLAGSGYTTYAMQPGNFVPPPGRPLPLPRNNIDTALTLRPDALIINFPSNDAAYNYSLQEQMDNFIRVTDTAAAHHIPVWVTTTQPRDGFTASQVALQLEMKSWIETYYGDRSIDFWTGIATAKDSISSQFHVDGIHVNNAGHEIFYERVLAKDIPDTLCAIYFPPPVPDSLNFFKGNYKQGMVSLLWQTAPRYPADTFLVEKSQDQKNWILIGTLLDTGNSYTSDYQFSDQNPADGFTYYRLVILSSSRGMVSGPVIQVLFPLQGGTLMVFPNPSRGQLFIKGRIYSDAVLSIFDLGGKLVRSIPHFSGDYLDLSALAPGFYILKINQQTQKFLLGP